jgi:hypothetical protein
VNRRALAVVLVAFLALWGAGLPRYVHVMTAHLPSDDGAGCTRCCSQCSLGAAPSEPDVNEPAVPSEEQREGSGSTETHDCSVCALLATLVTNVPALPAASLAWQPAAGQLTEAPTSITLRVGFDPHAARGPPTPA